MEILRTEASVDTDEQVKCQSMLIFTKHARITITRCPLFVEAVHLIFFHMLLELHSSAPKHPMLLN